MTKDQLKKVLSLTANTVYRNPKTKSVINARVELAGTDDERLNIYLGTNSKATASYHECDYGKITVGVSAEDKHIMYLPYNQGELLFFVSSPMDIVAMVSIETEDRGA